MKRIICSVVGLCFLAGSGIATAQSLADVAKQSQAQRKTKRPARVYTNADVPVTAAPTAATATEVSATPKEGVAADGAAAEGDAAKDPNAKPAEGGAKPGVSSGDEEKWRGRMTAAREAVSRAKLQLEGMRTRVLQLKTAKAIAGNDVNAKAAVDAQQTAAQQEFERLRADVEKYQKALTDLDAEARAAGVPAGWLR